MGEKEGVEAVLGAGLVGGGEEGFAELVDDFVWHWWGIIFGGFKGWGEPVASLSQTIFAPINKFQHPIIPKNLQLLAYLRLCVFVVRMQFLKPGIKRVHFIQCESFLI